jgi:glucosamine-6-phosphate deaminase
MVEGPASPEVPASALQRHPDIDVHLDDEAASQLSA